METKICSKCEQNISIEKFGKDKSKKDKLKSRCKKCSHEFYIERGYDLYYREKGKRPDIKEKRRVVHLEKKYGLTINDYENLFNSQNRCCKICSKSNIKFHVDHDHITGKIRGILCSNCNTAIGLFKDSVDNLIKAIAYISG